MKKLLAVLLCVLCLFSSLGVTSFALDGVFGEVISNVSSFMGFEEDDPIGYGITYDSNTFLSGVSSVMYEPKPTIKLTNPGTYTVTSDTPLAIDYQFVCWQDKNTKKYYYAGDKIYIDGKLTLSAVWEPKTDDRNRVVRTIVTAIEAFRRTLESFFGFYKYEYVEDPVNKIEDKNAFFDLDGLLVENHDYYSNKRYFEIGVEPIAEGVVYEPFSRTESIYFGGRFENVEEESYEKDADGNTIGVTNHIVTKFTGATKYSALYESTGEMREIEVKDENGNKYTKTYQIITVTLTDGVPDPITGQFITFHLPKGILRYTDGDQLKANNTFTFIELTTSNT